MANPATLPGVDAPFTQPDPLSAIDDLLKDIGSSSQQTPSTGKRRRSNDDEDEDSDASESAPRNGSLNGDTSEHEDENRGSHSPTPNSSSSPGASTPPVQLNNNVKMWVKRLTKHKKLRREHVIELNTFMNDPPNLREARMFVEMLKIGSRIEELVQATPPYQVSPAMEKNIRHCAAVVLLSTKLDTYKGDCARQHIVSFLLKHRFDLPPQIEHNSSDFSTLLAEVQEALTQRRASVKKFIRGSMNTVVQGPLTITPKSASNCDNIYKLAQFCVKKTPVAVTTDLCARVALMRFTYVHDSGDHYWDTLDANLRKIEAKAEQTKSNVTDVLNGVLNRDRDVYGVNTYKIRDMDIGPFQHSVEELMDTTSIDTASAET